MLKYYCKYDLSKNGSQYCQVNGCLCDLPNYDNRPTACHTSTVFDTFLYQSQFTIISK